MDIVKAEPDKTCDVCGEPAIIFDLDATDDYEPAFFCRDHDPRVAI